MEITRINHIENLQLFLEQDSGWVGYPEDLLDIERDCACQLIFNASDEEKQQACKDVYYIVVEPDYEGTLSSGQRELYEAMLYLQQNTVHSVVTVGQLMTKLNLKTPMPVLSRLDNLQTLNAIDGYA
ncbi:hypothetical protein QGP82_23585 [Leptothoe sp. LEGE 181152]|uniref:Uncharacterized protein n=1 Tax=Adonisia turfae CCMR0081 TaxID=2292702 RepID=A0A6M0RVN1_9CYAN|nr:hypothetical protein [Adonisia turfae]MDV3351705.1 hypothetical protein [Leptothoe sp. LEGE 181152]NEZ60156.1 hypothetical protein [Adonisia turfae CCMR0081]